MGLGTDDDKKKDEKKKLTTKKMPTKEDDVKENNDVQSINNKNIIHKTKRIKRSQYVANIAVSGSKGNRIKIVLPASIVFLKQVIYLMLHLYHHFYVP